MQFKLLGKSGLRVSEFCLGTMTFGEDWGWGASKEESEKQIKLFLNAGGNFIDTAANYNDGTSEEYLGELVHGMRDSLVLSTKYSLNHPDTSDPNACGNNRKNMIQTMERSLKRLRTDYIDLLYLHMWDYMTPVEEVLRGMDDLVRAGKVRYLAISDTPAWIIAEANTRADLMGWTRFIGVQAPYSLLDRWIERDIIPLSTHWDMAVLPWGILEAGILTGKFEGVPEGPTRHDPSLLKLSEKHVAVLGVLKEVAEETGRSMAQAAINWVRHRAGGAMIPVLGARTVAQLTDNLAALGWELSDDQMDRLDEVSAVQSLWSLGFPFGPNPRLYGATLPRIVQRTGG